VGIVASLVIAVVMLTGAEEAGETMGMDTSAGGAEADVEAADMAAVEGGVSTRMGMDISSTC